MLNYTTCAACHDTLNATEVGQNAHPGCEVPPSALDALVADYTNAIHSGGHLEAELEAEIKRIEHARPRLLAAALVYLSWGWPVFPLAPQGKAPAIPNPHAHGSDERATCKGECGRDGHGCLDATCDEDKVRAWWARYPQANVGLATGHRFDVIDIDARHGGMLTYQRVIELERERFTLPLGDAAREECIIPDTHGRVSTPGGLHFYVEPSGGGNRANWLPGIDIRGKGGYVVAPPSWLGEHPKRWTWLYKPSPRIRA